MSFARAATAGVDPRFVAMLRDLLVERAAVERGAEPVRATRRRPGRVVGRVRRRVLRQRPRPAAGALRS